MNKGIHKNTKNYDYVYNSIILLHQHTNYLNWKHSSVRPVKVTLFM